MYENSLLQGRMKIEVYSYMPDVEIHCFQRNMTRINPEFAVRTILRKHYVYARTFRISGAQFTKFPVWCKNMSLNYQSSYLPSYALQVLLNFCLLVIVCAAKEKGMIYNRLLLNISMIGE